MHGNPQFMQEALSLPLPSGYFCPAIFFRTYPQSIPMLLKFFKWTGIVLATLIMALTIVTGLRQDLRFDAPLPQIKASSDTAVIARGRHLVLSMAHCNDCHSKANQDSLLALGLDVPLSGGYRFALPVGNIYSRNLTSDKETGIGALSDGEIARALRYGVHPNGNAIFNFMPFQDMSDEDLTAIISYLRTQKPVRNPVPRHEPNLLGRMVIAFLVKPVGPSGPVPAAVRPDTTAAYGKYLAVNVAGCKSCHTKRDLAGRYTGALFAGGVPIEEEGKPPMTPPNLTPHEQGRMNGWTQETFISRFRMGKVNPNSPMPWNAFKRMTDDELKAIYKYLRTVDPAPTAEL
jgi:mono/diheme cytochrome c family protein